MTPRLRLPDGRELRYALHGPSDGVPLVWLHGTPGSSVTRHPDPAFYDRHRVRALTYDRPGYGASTRQEGRRVADAAADVAALADELGWDRFAVHGTSGGGPHALACAALLGERVTATAVVCGGGPPDTPQFTRGMMPLNVEYFTLIQERPEEWRARVAPLVEQMQRDPDGFLDVITEHAPAIDREVAARPLVRAMVVASFAEASRQGSAGWYDDVFALAHDWGFALGDVAGRVAFWQGTLDANVPLHHVEHMAASVAQADVHVLDGVGHLSMYDVEDGIVADLLRG
jgi:pimeloyl-ACP methyl ester carboxylesterase